MKEKMGKLVAIIAFVLAVFVSLMIIAFLMDVAVSEINSETEAATEDRFITLSYETNYFIVYDKETMVQYVVSNGNYNRGTFVMLVDKDGKPLIYEGGK